jgi:hypothetical protein
MRSYVLVGLFLLGCSMGNLNNPKVLSLTTPPSVVTSTVSSTKDYRNYDCYLKPSISDVLSFKKQIFPRDPGCLSGYYNFELDKNAFIRPIKINVDFNWITDPNHLRNAGKLGLALYLKASEKSDPQHTELTTYRLEDNTIYLWQLEVTPQLSHINEPSLRCVVPIDKLGEYDFVDASFDPPRPIERITLKDDTLLSTFIPSTTDPYFQIGNPQYGYIKPEQRSFYPVKP